MAKTTTPSKRTPAKKAKTPKSATGKAKALFDDAPAVSASSASAAARAPKPLPEAVHMNEHIGYESARTATAAAADDDEEADDATVLAGWVERRCAPLPADFDRHSGAGPCSGTTFAERLVSAYCSSDLGEADDALREPVRTFVMRGQYEKALAATQEAA